MLVLNIAGGATPTFAGLEHEIGRSESRVRSAPFVLESGGTVWGYRLEERLERLGYRRVHRRPRAVGEFFWGNEVFWIYRRAYRAGGREHRAELFALELGSGGRITGFRSADGPWKRTRMPALEPEILAETLAGDRARRRPIVLDDLPQHVWQAVLAAEDARFFEHSGVDARSLARALLANLRAGKVAQGGSTITQQLIKNRDLTPRRSLGRKASEAVRALALEADYDKREILQAYLNSIYFGHVDGLAVHGLGTAARAYFSTEADDLDLARAATLAGMIQSPNRLRPDRHPQRSTERRDWVLGRLEELDWATPQAVRTAQRQPVRVRPSSPAAPPAAHFVAWVGQLAEKKAPRRSAEGRGIVAETTLDPVLQRLAEVAVGDALATLGRRRSLRGAPLSAALVALDARDGRVLAYVGGGARGGFDRARNARRQPGSAIKPLILLEAFEGCGGRQPLFPARRVADRPLRLDLPSGSWTPRNSDGRFRGIVDVRQALVDSLNVPFVRLARWCGFDATAKRLRRAGLTVPEPPPPAMTLGAVEVSPLEMAEAYTVFVSGGRRLAARPLDRLERPGGRRLAKARRLAGGERRVAGAAAAYLVHDLLVATAADGTAGAAAIEGFRVAAKTGTSQDRRDAWLLGAAGGLVTAVWIGRDDDGPLGLGGATAAAPLWRSFMAEAVASRPPHSVRRPPGVVEAWIDPETGLRVRSTRRGAERALFRQGALPPRARFWRRDPPLPVVE